MQSTLEVFLWIAGGMVEILLIVMYSLGEERLRRIRCWWHTRGRHQYRRNEKGLRCVYCGKFFKISPITKYAKPSYPYCFRDVRAIPKTIAHPNQIWAANSIRSGRLRSQQRFGDYYHAMMHPPRQWSEQFIPEFFALPLGATHTPIHSYLNFYMRYVYEIEQRWPPFSDWCGMVLAGKLRHQRQHKMPHMVEYPLPPLKKSIIREIENAVRVSRDVQAQKNDHTLVENDPS